MSTAPARSRAGRNARSPNGAGALTRSQLRELQAELQRERARLERSLMGEAGQGGTPDGAAYVGGIGVRAPANAEGGLAVAVEMRSHARHAAIVDALTRLELGHYGRCARCQEGIPYGRLMVMPEATHCIACSSGI